MNLKEINRLLKIIKDRMHEPDKLLIYIERLEKELKDEWIKIDMNNLETLPKNFKIPYIVLYSGEYYEIARYSLMKKRWFTGTSWVDDVTHYKPLPEIPEEIG